MKILSKEQEEILHRERRFLNDLRLKMVEFNTTKEDLETLGRSIEQLDDLFLLVMVGEFNAGKSAVINALLGQKLLQEGVTPTTSKINILRFGETQEHKLVEENQEVILLPVDLLSEVSIVDTPGTNAIIRYHEELTKHFVPRADLVLFITSVDRPFTESEREFMRQIRDWGKKVVIVLNKTDLLQDEEELQQVINFVEENARALLNITPEIFTVSARLALRAKMGEPQLWENSNFGTLEDYIKNTLDQGSQVRLKFLNPLGVASHLVEETLQAAHGQRQILEKDLGLLRNVEYQQAVFHADKEKAFTLRMAEVENIFFEMEQRGDEFFEERFRLARMLDLIKKERMAEDFQRIVVADVPQQVERKVNDLIDWLVESDLRQWKAVTDYLADRTREYKDQVIGEGLSMNFKLDRNRLLDAIRDEADRVVKTYNKHLETDKIALDAQNAVATSLAIEVGAVGLGAIITALATTMIADVTGIIAASLIAVVGLFVIPGSRRKAKKDLHDRVASLRIKLVETLRDAFESEMERSETHIRDAIAPYSQFVRTESARTDQALDEMKDAKIKIEQLRSEMGNW